MIPFSNVQMVLPLSSQTNFLLPGFHLVMLFALACLLLRHFDRSATFSSINGILHQYFISRTLVNGLEFGISTNMQVLHIF